MMMTTTKKEAKQKQIKHENVKILHMYVQKIKEMRNIIQ